MIEVSSLTARSELEARFLTAFEANRSHILNGRGQSLAGMRDEAIQQFAKLGFPSPKTEAWKYTPIAKTLDHGYEIAINPDVPALSPADVEAFGIKDLDANVIVLLNGTVVSDGITEEGLTVVPLLLATDNPVFAEHYGRRAGEAAEVFTCLNTAFTRNGLFVHASRSVERPIHIINISAGPSDLFVQPRHLIVVDDECKLTVVESHVGQPSARHFTNAVLEGFVGQRGRLEYYRVQQDYGMSGVTSTYFYQKDDSYSSCTTITLAGETIRNNITVLPDGGFSESHLVGLFICDGKMHVDSNTLVDHAKPDCFSNELYKGVLGDSSRGVFNGKVMVRPDAQRTNAYQSNKSIVLTDSASMNAKPELEIYADDVKCSHGATTGRIDSEALFYLRSRGLSEQRARTMLLLAFARDVLESVRNVPLRNYLDGLVENRLG